MSGILFYPACVEQTSSLPTDPAGGAQIDLDEDDYELITLSGGAVVSLYGIDYDSFYVNSNGHITFTSGDATYYISAGRTTQRNDVCPATVLT